MLHDLIIKPSLGRLSSLLGFLGGLGSITGPSSAAPVPVANSGFELPDTATTSSALESWTGTNGSNSPSASVDFVNSGVNSNFYSDADQHLNMQVSYDVWQNIPLATAAYTQGTTYTLTLGVGNKSGVTSVANQSTYGFFDAGNNALLITGLKAASGIPVGTFSDQTLTFAVPPGSPLHGRPIQIRLQSRGSGRSFFDNVRLDASPMHPDLPGAITLPPTALSSTRATLNGQVTQAGGATPTVTLYWGTVDRGATTVGWGGAMNLGAQSGDFSAMVTTLSENVTYFYRVVASNTTGTVWSAPAQKFTTPQTPPSFTLDTATKIKASSATVGGSVTAGNGVQVTLYWGTVDHGQNAAGWENSANIGTVTAGSRFARELTGLSSGVTYYYTAVATNMGGSVWTTPLSFNTILVLPPDVDTLAASNIQARTAQLNAAVNSTGGDAPTVTFYYGLTDGMQNPANWAQSLNLGLQAGKVEGDIEGLEPNTHYFYSVRSQNAAGVDWGLTRSFTTDAISTPRIENRPATHITDTMAQLNAEVTSEGDEAPTVKIYWGTIDGGTVASNWANNATLGIDAGNVQRLLVGLTPGVQIFYRAYAQNSAGGVWAPSTASFTTKTSAAATGLVISEIHYDPYSAHSLTEYIEIHNPTAAAIDLSGWRLGGDISYTFTTGTIAAGGYVVVVQAPTAVAPSVGFDTSFAAVASSGRRYGPWTKPGETSTHPADHDLPNGDGVIELWNGSVLVEEVPYQSGFPWPTSPKGNGSSHTVGQSMHRLHPSLDASLGGAWRTGALSPGAVAAIALANPDLAPPSIRSVAHTPKNPTSAVPVVVSAKVSDPNGLTSVNLTYTLVNPGSYVRKTDTAYTTAANWVSLPMVDDGTNGDAYAGDSIYSVTMPAALQTHRRLVRYRITATDAQSRSITVPYPDDEQPNFAYFVYDGVPEWRGRLRPTGFQLSGSTTFTPPTTPLETYSRDLINKLPPWHLLAVATDVNSCQYVNMPNGTRYSGCLVYDGEVYDHIQFGVRGIGSTYNTGKNKWGLFFNRARNITVRDNWGRKFKESWNSLGLNANADPWAAVNRGAAGIDEAGPFRAFELAGVPSLRTTYVHWRVIDGATEVGTPGNSVTDTSFGVAGDGQYSGDLWGLYLALEPTENNFLDERNLPHGNIYAIEGSGADKKNQGPTQSADASDWGGYANALTGTTTDAYHRANTDLDSLYSFMAVSRLVGNTDVRPGDNFRMYHRSSDNRWVTMPYDLDMMFIAAHHWGGTLDGLVVAGAPLHVRALMRHADIARDYRNRCRELLSLLASDGAPNGGQIGQVLDEYAQMINPVGQALTWADLDAAMWNLHPKTTGNGSNTGQNNSKGNFYRALFLDGGRGGLGGTAATSSWIRNLRDPDNDGFSDLEGFVEFYTNFCTNTFPGTNWVRKATIVSGGGADADLNRQKGYGYKYLEWECLYGGYFDSLNNPNTSTADTAFPNKPNLSYLGTAGFPINNLTFASGDFSDPQGAHTIAAVEYRLGEISAPGIAGYDATKPRIYELETVWSSGPIATLAPTGIAAVRIPASLVRAGHTYRARVRHKDNTERWSYWSEPVEFIASFPDVQVYLDSLVISEINYNPSAPSAAERAAGFTNGDEFEFLELQNVSTQPLLLTDVRLTKGVDFDIPAGLSIAPGAYALIVRNLAAFRQRYGTDLDSLILGSYGASERLDNGGEQLKLSYGSGIAIRDFVYDDAAPWPTAPDGSGSTLVLSNPSQLPNHASPGNWRASVLPGGSPGRADGLTFAAWLALYGLNEQSGNDQDQDGLTNRMEFALGGNPLEPNVGETSVLPTVSIQNLTHPQTQPYLALTVNRPQGLLGVRYQAESSADLQTWTPIPAASETTGNEQGGITDTWLAPQPLGAEPRQYLRLRVLFD